MMILNFCLSNTIFQCSELWIGISEFVSIEPSKKSNLGYPQLEPCSQDIVAILASDVQEVPCPFCLYASQNMSQM